MLDDFLIVMIVEIVHGHCVFLTIGTSGAFLPRHLET